MVRASHRQHDHRPEKVLIGSRRIVFGLNLIILYFGVIFLPETSKSRPWGIFWKFVQSLGFTYSLNVFVLCFFSKENLQLVLKNIFDSRLGVPITMKDYASDCRVFTPEHPTSWFGNITDSLDAFVASHFLGWAFKVWVFRNKTMAWLMSIGFEIMELTFEVYLPNFRECWWDHLLLDVFGCNLIGMLIGFYTIDKFKMRKLHWFMEPSEATKNMNLWQKFKYSFTSRDEYIKNDKWHWLSEMWTFNGVVCFCLTNYALDLAYFFVKSQIFIPPAHWIFQIRIWVFAFFAILAVNDYYDYIAERKGNAMTMPIYITYFIIMCEWTLFYKNLERNHFFNLAEFFNASVYLPIRVFWIVLATLFVLFHVFFIIQALRLNATGGWMSKLSVCRAAPESSRPKEKIN